MNAVSDIGSRRFSVSGLLEYLCFSFQSSGISVWGLGSGFSIRLQRVSAGRACAVIKEGV